jgi:hypothetical protein
MIDVRPDLKWESARRSHTVEARDLMCYWATKELGMSATGLAKKLNLAQPAVIIAVCRGEKIAIEIRYVLMKK